MKGRVKNITRKINRLASILGSHHTGAYAAQAAYFFVLSLIPIILLLLTMVQFTPVTRQDVMSAVTQVFPTTIPAVQYDHSGDHNRSSVVCGKGRACDDIGYEFDL